MEENVSIRPDQKMTDNVLMLLRGSSRNVIRELKIGKQDVDFDRVIHEIELMTLERGTKFEKYDKHWGSRFTIHV